MLLSELLKDVEITAGGYEDAQIAFITDNSENVCENSVFVCIDGGSHDGHEYAAQALEYGARVVICERDTGVKNQITVKNSRLAYSKMCSAFFGNPAKSFGL